MLHGENGAGKTNLLEAVSLLAPGRGLRARAAGRARPRGRRALVASRATVDGQSGPVELATGARPRRRAAHASTADGQPLRSQTGLGEHRQPALADAGHGPAVRRRRRRAGAASSTGWCSRSTPAHAARVAAFERALRERSHLLRGGRRDPAWLAAIERRIAEAGVAVAAARRELVRDLDARAGRGAAFPSRARACRSTGEVEDVARRRCRRWRPSSGWPRRWPRAAISDAETGGAAVGPHRSDLVATDALRGEPAARCSTGRQKAFLISIVLAEARLRRRRHGDLPILLLDEVTAHLDPRRRVELLAALVELGAQCWLTGTEAGLFAPLRRRRHVFHVVNGALTPHE